jgi:outer membrane protein assembly factor BamA
MKNISIFAILSVFITLPSVAATVSRIDVVGNKRMDAESIRILADVKVGDNVGESRSNEIAKKTGTKWLFFTYQCKYVWQYVKNKCH